MRIKITITVGLTLTAIAVVAALQHPPLTVAATNGVRATARLGFVQGPGATCHTGEALPRDISAIRLSFAATTGPRIVLTLTRAGHIITGGAIASGWYGSAVTIPVRPLPRAYSNVTVCAHFGALTGDVAVLGEPATTVLAGRNGVLPGQLSVVYLQPGHRSWWSLAAPVIDRMALGRAASGRWIVFPIAALIAAAIALASLALTRELR